MARALWTGDISFGLVNIPVNLFPAEEHREFKFSMLDKRDFSPVGYKRYSKRSNKEVAWANIVKGYEYAKEQYVVLSDEDFRRANAKASQTIAIRSFVPATDVPTQFFETPYFLAPTERGKKVYVLLREALLASGRVAIAEVVIRTAQHLAAVVPSGRALMLNIMRYPDQLRKPGEVELPPEGVKAAGVSGKELELANRLVNDMSERWNPDEFKDTFHVDVMRRIREKIKKGETHEITAPEKDEGTQPRSAQIIDLTALLQQSLKGTGGSHSKMRGASRVAAKAVATRSRTAARRKRA